MAGQITLEIAKRMAPGLVSACVFADEYWAKKKLAEEQQQTHPTPTTQSAPMKAA